jgi:hypothetical protein
MMTIFGILALAVLASLFFWAFYWNGRVEATSYVGELLGEALYSAERQRLLKLIEEAWDRHTYHVKAMKDEMWRSNHTYPAPPALIAHSWVVQSAIRNLEQHGFVGTSPPGFGLTSDEEKETSDYLSRLREWADTALENRATSLYDNDVLTREQEARNASQRILGGIDLTILRGVGPEFILQFTAIVTIVFVVLLLGTIGNLASDQAGTILAAIAGYVLGQTTRTRTQSAPAAPVAPVAPVGLPARVEQAAQNRSGTGPSSGSDTVP